MGNKVTDKDYQDFFAEEYQKENENLRKQIERLKDEVERKKVYENLTQSVKSDRDYKINLLCTTKPEFKEYIETAIKNSGKDREWSTTVLRRNDKNGRFDITLETLVEDVPLLEDIKNKYGNGRYRIFLRYFDKNKTVKGGFQKEGFSVYFFDVTLSDPIYEQINQAEMAGKIKSAITDVVDCVKMLTEQQKAIMDLIKSYLEAQNGNKSARRR